MNFAFLYFGLLPFFILFNSKIILPLNIYLSAFLGIKLIFSRKLKVPRIIFNISIFWVLVFLFIPIINYSINLNHNLNYLIVFNLVPFLYLIFPTLYLIVLKVNLNNLSKLIFLTYTLLVSTLFLDAILHFFDTSIFIIFAKGIYTYAAGDHMLINKRVTGFFPEPSVASASLTTLFLLNRFLPYKSKNKILNIIFYEKFNCWLIYLVSLLFTASASSTISFVISILLGRNYLRFFDAKGYLQILRRFINPSKKIFLYVFIAAILLIFAYFTFNFDEKIGAIYQKLFMQILGQPLDASNADRLFRLNICSEYFRDMDFSQVIFGYGLGKMSNNDFTCVNFWFNQLLDTGLIGISLYLSILIFFILEFNFLRKKISNEFLINFNYIISSYVFLAVQLFFQTNFYMPIVWLPFIIGCILLNNKKLFNQMLRK